MRSLIVNADDFGLTAAVNRAVIDGRTRGIITSATMMTNMPAFDQAAALARETPALGVGLHFNITQGNPLSNPLNVQSLTNERGEFFGTSTVLAQRALVGKLKIEEVVVELRAQIERMLDAGLKITHIDSHQHSHALPLVCEAICRTIEDYGIGAVRLPRERWWFDNQALSFKPLKQGIVALGLSQLCRVSEAKLRRTGITVTDAFFGIAQTGFWTRQWLMNLIERLPRGVSELMCHPGYQDDGASPVLTRLRESRAAEMKLLTDPEIAAFVKECGVELINYSQIEK